jgi:competence ComEA-like helix-hairpin-helix protein
VIVLALAMAAGAAPIDLSTADAATLETLPGIGPEKAGAIVDWRVHHGAFDTVDELADVPGIGLATVRVCASLVVVSGNTASHAAPESPHHAAGHPEHAANEALDIDLVDVNTATVEELADLPGIGAEKAQLIVDDRATRGPYASCGELTRVEGIGPASVAGIASRCTASP